MSMVSTHTHTDSKDEFFVRLPGTPTPSQHCVKVLIKKVREIGSMNDYQWSGTPSVLNDKKQ